MYRNILLPQLKRAPWRTMLFFVLLAIATAFFCLSANLYLNSKSNIASSGDAFSTVAYLEFYKALNNQGQQVAVTDEGYRGTFSVVVDDLDRDALMALPGVKSVDLRPLLGGYIPGAVWKYKLDNPLIGDGHQTGNNGWFCFPGTLIRFTLDSETPITYNGVGYGIPIKVQEVLGGPLKFGQGTVKLHTYSYKFKEIKSPRQAAQLLQLNGGRDLDGGIYLEPGVEYLAAVFDYELSSSSLQTSYIMTTQDLYGTDFGTRYYSFGINVIGRDGVKVRVYETPVFPRLSGTVHEDQPFWLWRWEDVQNDPEIKAYFETVAQAYDYSACSYAVMPTDDLEGVPGFYQKRLYVKEGVAFSEEDHARGNRVCIVSAEQAALQDWQVGDTLDLSLYQWDHFYEGGNQGTLFEGHFPVYAKDNGGFFDRGEYTIIGIFDAYPVQTSSSLDPYTNNLEYNTILVPASSVQNLDSVDAPASGSRLTVHLENGTMDAFLEAASKVTLSESADEVRVSAFDQGYSQAQDSLQSMLGTAQFLLALAAVLLVVAGVLLAFFYTQNQKHNMALMRLLGCSRRQAGTMSLLGSLMILLPGGALGTAAGHLLTDRVASAILNGTSALDKPEYAGFREIFGVQAAVDYALSAQPAVSAAALAVAAALFLAGCLIFTLQLLRKEPRAALQDK